MNLTSDVLAFDFGASSGRAMLGRFDGTKIELTELHRFSNDPVTISGTMYWDVLRLVYEMKQGLLKAKPYSTIESIGIDTWGVDFGLLDKDGRLLENPVHYRDARTVGVLEKAFQLLPAEMFYHITGNQFMEINTAFQLLALKNTNPALLERAHTLLMMPDLLRYFLTGVKQTEYSIASTTQLLDAEKRRWSSRIIEALGLPPAVFTPIVPTASAGGVLSEEICSELGMQPRRVTAVAGHDTQCALAAVPASEKDFIFLSCGTWSLLGTELDAPMLTDAAQTCNMTNEGGYADKTSFLKNIIGLWLIQETRRQWKKEGVDLSFSEMEKLARAAAPFQCYIDPDAPEFVQAGDIPARICAYCADTGQKAPQSKGEILRCIYESLAMKYRYAVEQIEFCTQKSYPVLYVVGGGARDTLLCQLTASACAKRIFSGPVEATAFGNVALQLLAMGKLHSLDEARRVIADSDRIAAYFPTNTEEWNLEYQKFKEAVSLA